jgi:hypothetical protein
MGKKEKKKDVLIGRCKDSAPQEERARKLKARKERDASFGYKYASCKYCGQAVRYRGDIEPAHCGKEECQSAFMRERLETMNKTGE